MKHILLLISFISLFMSVSSFAAVDSTDQLDAKVSLERISMMLPLAEQADTSIAMKRMIVTSAVESLAKSQIITEDTKLRERLDNAVASIYPTLSKSQKRILDHHVSNLR